MVTKVKKPRAPKIVKTWSLARKLKATTTRTHNRISGKTKTRKRK